MKDTITETISRLPMLPESLPPKTPSSRFLKPHAELAAEVDALNFIEVHKPRMEKGECRKLRIAAWNLERCKHPKASAALLARTGADISLLSEMDYGMARSGNRHTTFDLSNHLSSQFAFALEFAEFGLGNSQEEAIFQGQSNSHGFHGNAIISQLNFEKPSVIRLDEGGLWYSLDWHHPRIGSRNALFASFEINGREFVTASVHLENLQTPEGWLQR